MPQYYTFMVCGYYLYFTSHCIIEAMHVHASDRKLTEAGSAKFFVMSNGDTTVENCKMTVNLPAGRWTHSPKFFRPQIARATLRQPRGQRPIGDAPWHVSTRRHLLPTAVLRGGGGVRGGEMVMGPLTGFCGFDGTYFSKRTSAVIMS